MPRRSPTLCAAVSPGARPFHRARRSSAIPVSAGTAPRRRTTVRSRSHWTLREEPRLSFALPLGVILPVDEIDVRLDPAQHPFERGREEAIAENWRREVAAKPALFDGTVVLLSEFGYDAGKLFGRCHAVRYSTFLHWRKDRVATAAHAFAHPMLVSSDNALVAI